MQTKQSRASKSAPPGTQVVQRVTSILKSFTAELPEWNLTSLASALELKKSTAHRLLAALEAEGFVEHDTHSQNYRLGPALLAIGLQAMSGRDLKAMALPFLHALASESKETCSLEMQVGREILVVAEVTGEHLVGASGCVGTRWPLHATSSGKAILASLPSERWNQLIRTPLEIFTAATIRESVELKAELERVAEQGFAIAVDELEIGYAAVSAPIPCGEKGPNAALSIGGPSSRLNKGRLLELGRRLQAAVEDLAPSLLSPAVDL